METSRFLVFILNFYTNLYTNLSLWETFATMNTEKACKLFIMISCDEKKLQKTGDGVFVLYKWFNTADTCLNIDASTYRWYFSFLFHWLHSRQYIYFCLFFFFSFFYYTSPTKVVPSTRTRWSWSNYRYYLE